MGIQDSLPWCPFPVRCQEDNIRRCWSGISVLDPKSLSQLNHSFMILLAFLPSVSLVKWRNQFLRWERIRWILLLPVPVGNSDSWNMWQCMTGILHTSVRKLRQRCRLDTTLWTKVWKSHWEAGDIWVKITSVVQCRHYEGTEIDPWWVPYVASCVFCDGRDRNIH